MVRNKWKRYEGYKYYFGEDGYACIGGSKIGNKAYVFDENGHLWKIRRERCGLF